MYRIDSAGAVPGGFFTDGDPQVGTPATVVPAAWLNAVQEELVGVVLGAGLALTKPDSGQVVRAILALIDRAVPAGQVIQGYFTVAPAGFLLCAGGLVSRATYSRLFAHVTANGLLASEVAWAAGAKGLFGEGDGATTFRLPDLRGEFIRGHDAGRGVDVARGLGTWQDEAFKSHTHDTGSEAGGGGNFATPIDSSGVDETQAGNPTQPAGGPETRPRNVALAFAVRF